MNDLGLVILGGVLAIAGSVITGLFLYWLDGRRLKRQWAREDRIRAAEDEQQHLQRMQDYYNEKLILYAAEIAETERQMHLATSPKQRANLQHTLKELQEMQALYSKGLLTTS